jgi:hypothetical protein
MHFVKSMAVGFAVALLASLSPCTGPSSVAYAQQQVLITGGEDGGRGTQRIVAVDAQGRLIISNPGGGGGGGGTLVIDGGIQTFPVTCGSTSVNGFTSVGTSSTAVPASAASGRLYTRVCLSLEASGTPLVKCRTDGTAPAFGTTPGEVLSVGDCVTYTTPAIACIANAASTPVSTFECR